MGWWAVKTQTEVVAWSAASIMSVGAGVAASIQTMLDPATTWVPLVVLVALLGLAVGTTVKIVRLLDGIRADIEIGKRERRRIAKAHGVDLGDDG